MPIIKRLACFLLLFLFQNHNNSCEKDVATARFLLVHGYLCPLYCLCLYPVLYPCPGGLCLLCLVVWKKLNHPYYEYKYRYRYTNLLAKQTGCTCAFIRNNLRLDRVVRSDKYFLHWTNKRTHVGLSKRKYRPAFAECCTSFFLLWIEIVIAIIQIHRVVVDFKEARWLAQASAFGKRREAGDGSARCCRCRCRR